MHDISVIFGATIMGGFIAASVTSIMGMTSGDAGTGVLLAGGAGFGLGLLLTGFRRDA